MNLSTALQAEFAKVSDALTIAMGKPDGNGYYLTAVELVLVNEGEGQYVACAREVKDGPDIPFASFKMRNSLQCNAIAVPFHVEVAESLRGRGIGKILELMRIEAARAADYALMLATTRADNAQQVHIMRVSGWNYVLEFYNAKTEHNVILWRIDLSQTSNTPVGIIAPQPTEAL